MWTPFEALDSLLDPSVARERIDEPAGAAADPAAELCWRWFRFRFPQLDLRREWDRLGRLIRHACSGFGCWPGCWFRLIASAAAAAILALTVAMIEPSFLALLMPPVGGAALLAVCLALARDAAIALSAVAVLADEEYGETGCSVAGPLPEDEFMG